MSDDALKIKKAIESLSSIPVSLPNSISSSKNPAISLLHDRDFSSHISNLLYDLNSGSGDNNLCRWLYDTFQSGVPDLQILVLRFLPTISGLYLSRVLLRKPLAGFEAVLLALYHHETTSRDGQAICVNIPSLAQPTIYHESKESIKNHNSTNLNLAVVSHTLEPHGTVRSTRRARIVGVALELYYNKIVQMPVGSKIDFCHFCKIWAGEFKNIQHAVVEEVPKIENAKKDDEDDDDFEDVNETSEDGNVKMDSKCKEEKDVKKEGRIPLPWDLLQPVLRILGHCMMGPSKNNKLWESACEACKCLYARSLHDMNPKAILAIGSLIKLSELATEEVDDPTEIPVTDIITV